MSARPHCPHAPAHTRTRRTPPPPPPCNTTVAATTAHAHTRGTLADGTVALSLPNQWRTRSLLRFRNLKEAFGGTLGIVHYWGNNKPWKIPGSEMTKDLDKGAAFLNALTAIEGTKCADHLRSMMP